MANWEYKRIVVGTKGGAFRKIEPREDYIEDREYKGLKPLVCRVGFHRGLVDSRLLSLRRQTRLSKIRPPNCHSE